MGRKWWLGKTTKRSRFHVNLVAFTIRNSYRQLFSNISTTALLVPIMF